MQGRTAASPTCVDYKGKPVILPSRSVALSDGTDLSRGFAAIRPSMCCEMRPTLSGNRRTANAPLSRPLQELGFGVEHHAVPGRGCHVRVPRL